MISFKSKATTGTFSDFGGERKFVAASLCEALVARRPTIKKSCRIQSESCSSILRLQLRLIFDYHTLNGAMLRRPGIINPDSLAGSQRGRYDFAGRVNNVRSRA